MTLELGKTCNCFSHLAAWMQKELVLRGGELQVSFSSISSSTMSSSIVFHLSSSGRQKRAMKIAYIVL